jgi:hypothetical protein
VHAGVPARHCHTPLIAAAHSQGIFSSKGRAKSRINQATTTLALNSMAYWMRADELENAARVAVLHAEQAHQAAILAKQPPR